MTASMATMSAISACGHRRSPGRPSQNQRLLARRSRRAPDRRPAETPAQDGVRTLVVRHAVTGDAARGAGHRGIASALLARLRSRPSLDLLNFVLQPPVEVFDLAGVEQVEDVPAPELSRYAVPEGPRRSRVTTALRVDVVVRYQRGESSREVAATCGIAKSTVLKILRSEGIEVRSWGVRYR